MTHCSRGEVRLVGYILHQTLQWLDENGKPIEEDIPVSFDKIVKQANVSRGAARQAIDDSIAKRFITCVTPPMSNQVGKAGRVGEYSLVWHDRCNGPDESFRGFFAGEGRRTPVPHDFFTTVLCEESLAVSRVVAAVIRHTIFTCS